MSRFSAFAAACLAAAVCLPSAFADHHREGEGSGSRDNGGFKERGSREGGRGERGPRGERGRPPVPPLVKALDADGDGTISGDEIAAASDALLTLDGNGDGVLTLEEIRPPRPHGGRGREGRPGRRGDGPPEGDRGERGGPRGEGRRGPGGPNAGGPQADGSRFFDRFDEDGDGVVKKADLPERAQRMFDRVDADGDGEVTREEFSTAVESFRGRGGRPGAGGPDGPRRGGRGEGADGRPAGGGALLGRIDADGNGKISYDEAPERLRQVFEDADVNDDDELDADELTEIFAAMRERRGQR